MRIKAALSVFGWNADEVLLVCGRTVRKKRKNVSTIAHFTDVFSKNLEKWHSNVNCDKFRQGITLLW